MGTRHLIAVVSDEEYKIAQYGQWDGYPSGQGIDILNFLSDDSNIDKLKLQLGKVRFIDNDRDKAFIDAYNKVTPQWSNETDKRTPEQVRWFSTYISRDLGAEILNNIVNSKDEEILLKNSISFASDLLFCEWFYVIDFDKNTLEIRGEFNQPVITVKTYNLDDLPTKKDFLEELTLNE